MPSFQDRRPKHLAALVVPKQHHSVDIHTPIPCTPVSFEPAPLVMTPDTPCFMMDEDGPGKSAPAAPEPWTAAEDATITSYLNHPPRPLRNNYPPNSLPPPAALDELTTQLVNTDTWPSSRSWQATRSRFLDMAQNLSAAFYGATRKRQSASPAKTRASARELFVSPLGEGTLDVTPTNRSRDLDEDGEGEGNGEEGQGRVKGGPPPIEARPLRPKLRVLGGAKMSRQQHSMDSLYGDAEAGTMSEALRLSNTLQNRAQSELNQNDLSGNRSLSSPLAFTFNFNAPKSPRKASNPLSSSLPSSAGFPRPSSLLNRGRSFTSQEIPSIPSTIDENSSSGGAFTSDTETEVDPATQAHPGLGADGAGITDSPVHVRPDMVRSVSSPVSSFTTSPPSSISSATSSASVASVASMKASEELGMTMGMTMGMGPRGRGLIDLDEPEPFTPLNQIFPNSLGLREPPPIAKPPSRAARNSATGSSGSNETTPAAGPGPASTPAITLTTDSPELGGTNATPTLIAPSLPSTSTESRRRPKNGAASPGTTAKELAFMSISPPTQGSSSHAQTQNQPQTTSHAGSASASDSGSGVGGMPNTYGSMSKLGVGAGVGIGIGMGMPSSNRAPRPAPLSRSYSEGMQPPPMIPISRSAAQAHTAASRAMPPPPLGGNGNGNGNGAGLLGPMAKRQKGGNSNGLSVFVPRPNGRMWAEELRSPFEHKTPLAGSAGSGESSGSITPTSVSEDIELPPVMDDDNEERN